MKQPKSWQQAYRMASPILIELFVRYGYKHTPPPGPYIPTPHTTLGLQTPRTPSRQAPPPRPTYTLDTIPLVTPTPLVPHP